MSRFEDHFPKQTQNIKDCVQLSDEQREDFFEAIGQIDGEEREIRKEAYEYFRKSGRKLCGEIAKLGRNKNVGRVHLWVQIEDLIEKSNKESGDYTPTQNTKGPRERFSTGDSKTKKNVHEEIIEFLNDIGAPSPLIIWAFVFHESDRLFKEGIFKELPCRLGLENTDPDDYFPLQFGYSPKLGARVPTAFDAELYEYWCPGGFTCPRDGCLDKKGLEEVVICGAYLNLWGVAKFPPLD